MPVDADPGKLLGSGRAADVYALDSTRVLRRYRIAFSCAAEAELMRYLRQAGFRVPAVHDADGRDLVMERLDGRTMLDDVAARPWRVIQHARTLALLHDQLHAIAAPPGLPLPFGSGRPGDQSDRILHLDLHPANVMLTRDGPAVIDWTNAAAGPPAADVAMAYLIMASSDTDDLPSRTRWVASVGRRIFLRSFRAAVTHAPGPYLAQAARIRMTDRSVRPAEAARLDRIARQHDSAR